MRTFLAAVLGLLIGFVARVWMLSVRTRVVLDPALSDRAEHPWVLALWHGHLLPLLAHRRRGPTVALVSWSSDGTMLAWAMRWFGVDAERGSSSRGGRVGLSLVTRRLRTGWDAAFAVDGPRGPCGVVRPGALAAARDVRGCVVPYVAACSHAIRLRSWDGFLVPLPFSRVVIHLGAPVAPAELPLSTEDLATHIDAAVRFAQESLEHAEHGRYSSGPRTDVTACASRLS